ncbi:MAG: lytic transglycosylase domain-containing protein [Devosia sp.]|nr:lytic transglycosylase domain-containing protein [Devosia sp.]
MRARVTGLAATMAMAVVISGCSMAALKPLPGNKQAAIPATSAIETLAAAATPEGHVPKANAVPRANPETLLGFAQSERGSLDGLISHYSSVYNVPESLVRRVIVRESNYNPAARNGPYYGLMQISHATARGMGYSGEAAGLLDAETNLRYAVRYLAGAYITAGGNHDRSVQFYARGYYYDAKRLGLLQKTGLR